MQLSEKELVDRAMASLSLANDDELIGVKAGVRATLNAVAEHNRAQADARPVNAMLKLAHDAFSDYLDTGGGSPVAQAKFMNRMREFNLLYNTHPEASAPGLSDDVSSIRAALIGLANHVRAVPAYSKLLGDMEQVDKAIAILTRASAATVSEAKPVYDCSTRNCQCDACRIERGETGPFNDDEGRTEAEAAQQAEPGADEREEAGSLIGDGFVLEFERWNDVTGALPRNGSWLAEVSDIIQRAAQSGQRAGKEYEAAYKEECQTMLAEGIGYWKAKYEELAGQRAGVPENDPYCPRCKGHGEETAMSNNGPDAEELSIACQHCGGEGSLSEAYKGVAKLLAEEQKKYLDACGRLWFERHGDAGQRANVATLKEVEAVCRSKLVRTGDDFALGAHHLAIRILAMLAAPTQQQEGGE